MSSTKPPVRVRFAPSPTGYLHVGSIRSGLYNWLWARHNQGVSVLRIEDTDRLRLVPEALDQINDSLEALGIAPDEGPRQGGDFGPYIQSERLDLYHEHAEKLLKTGALYRCWCSTERLAELREKARAGGYAFKYDRFCLPRQKIGSVDEPHVLRFRMPETPAEVAWDDAVRGNLRAQTADLDDFVAVKADGFPTYHFANVVDDHLMQISHVLRADEWIPSTPKHILLFAAFGWQPPVYAHLPAVQGPSGTKKLSKRDGAQSVQEYIDEGFLPEALMSFLATLGWNDGTTQEVFTPDELIEKFTLGRVQKSPAKFDRDRLVWTNGLIIRGMEPEKLLEQSARFWPKSASKFNDEYLLKVLGLVQERLKFLSEIPDLTGFFFADPAPKAGELTTKLDAETAKKALEATISELKPAKDWTPEGLEHAVRPLADSLDLRTGPYFGLLRMAATGRTAAPGLFDTLAVLGAKLALGGLNSRLSSFPDKKVLFQALCEANKFDKLRLAGL